MRRLNGSLASAWKELGMIMQHLATARRRESVAYFLIKFQVDLHWLDIKLQRTIQMNGMRL